MAWSTEQAEAWAPADQVKASEWNLDHRHLSVQASPSAPGPFRFLAPWQEGILDAIASPVVQEFVGLKCPQISLSELVRCAIAAKCQSDPGPVLWVMDVQFPSAKKAMAKIELMFEDTPALRGLVSSSKSDTGAYAMTLRNGMEIACAWAGSRGATASDPWQWVILDEVAKYAESIKGEGDLVGYCKHRYKVFGPRGKAILISSPRHSSDGICTNYDATLDKRKFYVPCPECRLMQELVWERARWRDGGTPDTVPTDPKERRQLAKRIEETQEAWIACADGTCQGRINPQVAMWDKSARWMRETDEGPVDEPLSKRVAFHISELYHWSSTISDVVGKFLRAVTPKQLQDFWNGVLGLPFRHAEGLVVPEVFTRRAIHEPRIIPAWACAVVAGVDTQGDHFYFQTRAWAPNIKSRAIDQGIIRTFDDLDRLVLKRRYPIEGTDRTARLNAMAIDSGGGMLKPGDTEKSQDGSRTQEVYDYARRRPFVYAVKGQNGKQVVEGVPVQETTVKAKRKGRPGRPQKLLLIHVNYWEDVLADLIDQVKPHVAWEECKLAAEGDYAKQMSSHEKVTITGPRGTKETWQPKRKGIADHYRDCGIYGTAIAIDIVRINNRSLIRGLADSEIGEPGKTGGAYDYEEDEEDDEGGGGWQIGR